jgi:hypothetical protein
MGTSQSKPEPTQMLSQSEYDAICFEAATRECSPLDYMIEILDWDTSEAEEALAEFGY